MRTPEFLYLRHCNLVEKIVDEILEHYYETGEESFSFNIDDCPDDISEEEIQKALDRRING